LDFGRLGGRWRDGIGIGMVVERRWRWNRERGKRHS